MNIVQNSTTYVQAIEIDNCQWVLSFAITAGLQHLATDFNDR